MSDKVLRERAIGFAKQIVFICRRIGEEKHETVLSTQLLRCGTAVGAILHGAQYAQGTKDRTERLESALKECCESEYWLELLRETALLSEEEYHLMQYECGAIRRMLLSALTPRKKKKE